MINLVCKHTQTHTRTHVHTHATIAPADYQGPSMDLTFGPGITRRCVDVTVVEDDIMENTENFFGSLTTTDTLLTLDPDVAEVVISEDSSDSEFIEPGRNVRDKRCAHAAGSENGNRALPSTSRCWYLL